MIRLRYRTLDPRRSLSIAALAAVALLSSACGDATTSAETDVALARPSRAANTVNVNVGGLPAGTSAAVLVSGPNGYTQQLTGSSSLTDLGNGTYTITSSSVSASGVTYTPSPATQSVSVNKGSTATATVAYTGSVTTGSLGVSISIASGIAASVNVTGPNGFARALTASTTLTGLATGSYSVAANVVTSGGTTYTPSPASQTVSVASGTTASAAVAYTASTPVDPPSGLNLQIAGMYVSQSVQTMSGAVPLLANRDAVLRVFAVANAANSATPSVRARLYRNGTLLSTLVAAAPAASVPTAVNEGSATASWNFPLPASLVQGGLTVIADVDNDNTVAESVEGDNQFPVNGTPRAFDVRNAPPLAVRFVPVLQSATGQLGGVTDANSAAFLSRLKDMHPVSAVSSSVRAAYTTSRTITNSSPEWSGVLSELRALRTADGSSENYYGVAKVSYSSGIAGIGYIGAQTAMGWDYLPSASEVMAHELGHNWGRQHAPCGGVSSADPSYPYAGGTIGVFGFNVRLGQLISSSSADLMGYCNQTWISDYTYQAVMNFRGTTTASLMASLSAGGATAVAPGASSVVMSAATQPGLLVWGRVMADGTIVVEPAVRLSGRSVLPATGGSFTAEAFDASGSRVFSISFDPDLVAPEEGAAERHFAFLIPVSDAAHDVLRTLRVRGEGRSAERTSNVTAAAVSDAADDVTLDAVGSSAARVRWDASRQGMVVVRDPGTGQILSFARGGDASVFVTRNDLELVYSDGVRSASRLVRVRGR